MTKEVIDKSSFLSWQDHPVTIKLMEVLSLLESDLKEKQLNPEVFLHPDSRVGLARLLGSREVIERILDKDILFQDLTRNEEIDDKQEMSESPW